MASDGKVVFEIVGDNTKIKQSITNTTKDIQTEAGKWEKSVDDSSGNISSSLVNAFKVVTTSAAFIKIGQMLAQLGMASINVASDLEEVQNVVDVTFGAEGSKKIESWAKQAGQAFGLTELQAKQYSGYIGAMLKTSGFDESEITDMSIMLAEISADLASFYNLDFDAAYQKVFSGLAGMSRPLRELGIDLSVAAIEESEMAAAMGESYKDMSQKEKLLLRYNEIVEQTAIAQGDFARTADSYANSQRRVTTGFETLKAQLGEAILPIATAVSNSIAELLEVLTYVPPETVFDQAQESINEASDSATQAQGILGYMEKLYQQYGEEATKTEAWASALERLKQVMPDITKYINEETGALELNNQQLSEYIANWKQKAIEEAKQRAVSSLMDQYTEVGNQYYSAEIQRDIATENANQAVREMISYIKSKPGYEDFTGEGMGIGQLSKMAYELAGDFGDSADTIEAWADTFESQTEIAREQQGIMDGLSEKMTSIETDLANSTAALDRMSAAAEGAASALASVGSGEMVDGRWTYTDIPSHAAGIEYVPRDNYLALLHKGERVQTAAEASLSRQYGIQQPSFNYDTFGSAMWAKAPKMGGNVYLDGQTVGKVISQMQGNAYRNLQRSGWQG